MKTFKVCLPFLLGVLLGAPALANDLELGMQALENGYVRRAIELWTPLAEQGDAEAQFGLGVIYNDAVGVPRDYTEANYWFLRAAEQGYAPAQFNLGNAYKNATGFSADAGMAVIWWRKAAQQDFAPAQFNLGTALLEGAGAPRDAAAGLEWYRRAAANGHPHVQRYLDEFAAGNAVGKTAPETARAQAAPPGEPEGMSPATDVMPRAGGNDALPARPSGAAGTVPSDCADWLARSGAVTHTVQLMASREAGSAQTYAAQHALTDTAVCSYTVQGRSWHALLFGRYPSAAAASAALATLPARVRADGAYVRHIREIRSALVAGGGNPE
jgi:TPR repeat protein